MTAPLPTIDSLVDMFVRVYHIDAVGREILVAIVSSAASEARQLELARKETELLLLRGAIEASRFAVTRREGR